MLNHFPHHLDEWTKVFVGADQFEASDVEVSDDGRVDAMDCWQSGRIGEPNHKGCQVGCDEDDVSSIPSSFRQEDLDLLERFDGFGADDFSDLFKQEVDHAGEHVPFTWRGLGISSHKTVVGVDQQEEGVGNLQ